MKPSSEPLRWRILAAFVVIVLTRFGVHLDHYSETLIDGASLWFCTEWARLHVTPTSKPRAAASPAPKEHPVTDILTTLKNDIAPLFHDAHELWNALPADFQHPALAAVQSGVDKALALAETEIEKVAPASLDTIIDMAKQAIQADADKRIAALETVKTAAAG